jgi:hypothetical protein
MSFAYDIKKRMLKSEKWFNNNLPKDHVLTSGIYKVGQEVTVNTLGSNFEIKAITFKQRNTWYWFEVKGIKLKYRHTSIQEVKVKPQKKQIEKIHTLESLLSKNILQNSKYKTYLMIDERTGYVKIGKSHHPRYREATLQSENPSVLLHSLCDYNVEVYLHRLYEEKRIRGEWFDLDIDDIKHIVNNWGFNRV